MDQHLTYDQLNRAANRLAHVIVAVRCAEGPVALLLDHGLSMIIGLLAAVKTGRAYVALDPSFPEARLTYTVTDSHAPIVVVSDATAALGDTVAQDRARVVNLEALGPDVPDVDLDIVPDVDDLMVVTYTSGSTGPPKGVMRTHRQLLHSLWVDSTLFTRAPGARQSLLYFCHFSASIRDVFGALLNGATLCPFNMREAGIHELATWLGDQRISHLHLPVSVARALADHATHERRFPELRVVELASGRCLTNDLERYRELVSPECVFFHGLSTSEAGAITRLRIDRDTQIDGDVVPLGVPIGDTEVFLVHENGAPVEAGDVGEIVVRSEYLSPGYLGKPEQTDRVFVAEPESGNWRRYHTGDLGRVRPDGQLELHGRKDFQVKIRGFRVGLREIERVLESLPSIQEAVVVARRDTAGGQDEDARLVAYVVPTPGDAIDVAATRDVLREQLASYMIPAAFVVLDRMPRTPNGKPDRQALPPPGPVRLSTDQPVAPPQNDLEAALVRIWADVLRVPIDVLSVDDDFLELGGDSLLAARIVSRVADLVGSEIPASALLRSSTVSEMAAAVSERRSIARGLVIPRRTTPGPWPASFAQERFWFLELFEAETPVYNMARLFKLEGPLRSDLLECALRAVIDRHESLRTVITMADGEPKQDVLEQWSFNLGLVDLRDSPPDERERRLAESIDQGWRRRFDLTRDLMLRATLFRLGDGDHCLLLVGHHISSDHWSSNILMREVSELYDAALEGRRPALAPLPVQYADYAVWERSQLEGGGLDDDVAYWTRRLAGPPPRVELPTDRPRPPKQTYRGARVPVVFPRPLTQALNQLARSHSATPFTVIMALLQTLLHRYSGLCDITVGYPVAGRSVTQTEPMIGNLINTLPLRTDLSGDPTFAELVRRVREELLDGIGHAKLPFARLVEEVQPERDPSRAALVDVMLDFANVPGTQVDFPGLNVERLPLDRDTSPFDLSWYLHEVDGQLAGALEYSTDLFDRSTVERMASHLRILAESAAANPETCVSELPLLGGEELRQITVGWNPTPSPVPAACVHELIAQQASRTPAAIAVESDSDRLSFEALERQARQLAHHLRERGVRPGDRVGVCLDRSIDLVVVLIGVLKTGAAYLPLEPGCPQPRLDYMVSDAQPRAIVTHAAYADRWNGRTVVEVDRQAEMLSREPATPVAGHDTPEQLAYVIYTSGSTGTPKGVSVPHRCVVNLLSAIRERPGLSDRDVLLAVTTPSFDISVVELFLPLVVGARIRIVDEETASDGRRLTAALADSQATVMQATPATWRMLLDAGWRGAPNLRVMCGGEALPPDLAEQLLSRVEQVWNLYGPTETTVWSTCGEVRPGEAVTVGTPIANTEVYVLDERGRVVPIGVPGELYIGGAGVSAGYWGQPELTAERFVANPVRPDSPDRVYRTGDIARWRPDGTLQHLGRADRQVKVRGHRIEPGEIEVALRAHPDVEGCVVAARMVEGELELIAYVVPTPGATAAASALRQSLRDRLPDYMVPGIVVELPALPLTPNGKVDWAALPEPSAGRPVESAYEPPQTPVEQQLAAIWQDVLKVDRVGRHDNFFELGGHSLSAMRVINRVAEALEVDLSVTQLFGQATLADLAAVIDGQNE